jgi:hypothetical protein
MHVSVTEEEKGRRTRKEIIAAAAINTPVTIITYYVGI